LTPTESVAGRHCAAATVLASRSRATILAALAAAALASPASGATEPAAVLTCTNLVSGFQWQIRIDFERSTVDANPARISTSQISWHDTDGGNYTLDRKSGSLTVVFPSSTGGYFLHDRCRPQS